MSIKTYRMAEYTKIFDNSFVFFQVIGVVV